MKDSTFWIIVIINIIAVIATLVLWEWHISTLGTPATHTSFTLPNPADY